MHPTPRPALMITFAHTVKVFKRMGFQIDNDSVSEVVNCKPGAIEAVLMTVQEKVGCRRPLRSFRVNQVAHRTSSRWPRTEHGEARSEVARTPIARPVTVVAVRLELVVQHQVASPRAGQHPQHVGPPSTRAEQLVPEAPATGTRQTLRAPSFLLQVLPMTPWPATSACIGQPVRVCVRRLRSVLPQG